MIRESINRVNVRNKEAQNSLLGLMVLEQIDLDGINESELNEGVSDILKKFGLEFEKKSPGVIEYIAKFTSGVGKLLYYGIKKDKKKVTEIAKSFTKEEFLDFLLKLDMVTMHMVTGPIHFVNGITGWDLEANLHAIKKSAASSIVTFKKTLNSLKTDIVKFFDNSLQPVAIQKVSDIEKLI